ncbi:hypothetical protein MKW98_003744 [Papaver atlanticum]|uniref:FBD domain-containing protein n=1 Tax=Papaver atlanticum TaxID=357466 RepID=A0AAD4T5P9_9MAGN|nr:hypothetical protein MKW98_003744 [Papaver atlanticum]
MYDIDQMETLLNFLELSPNLESLIIDQVNFTGNGSGHVSTFKVVPSCLVVSLKSIEIRKFNGYLEMVKYVLMHGRVLQMVIIETYYSVDPTDRRYNNKRYNKKNIEAKRVEALNKSLMTILRQTPWASAGCVIKFLSS